MDWLSVFLRENLVSTILISIGFLLPDFYLGTIAEILTCSIPLTTLCGVVGFSFILSFVKNRWFLGFILTVTIITQCIQLNHWAYFGTPIHSHDISKAFLEVDEIAETGAASFAQLWQVWVATCLSILLILIGLIYFKKRKRIPYCWVLVLLILCITPVLSYIKGPSFFYTKPTSSTIYNTIRAFSDWLVNSNSKVKAQDYKPYNITYGTSKVKNIVVIIGESISSRYMHLYGYDKKNTPFLDSLKNTPNFAFSRGVSSSVATTSALQLFFNSFHNPGFVSLIRKKDANLFRIAKQQGYKTFVISAQNEKLFHDTGVEFVDSFASEKDIKKDLAKKGDEALIDMLETFSLGYKNLIVIHLRHIHSPFDTYTKYYPDLAFNKQKTKDRETQTQQEYANALLYHDYWVKECINAIQKILPLDTVVFFTSDHGELVGERGLYGHNLMEPEVVDVPIWALAINTNPSHIAFAKNTIVSHYDLAKHISALMGATIINPNEDPKKQFIHSSEIYTNYQFMPWDKDSQNVTFLKKEWLNG